MRNLLTVATSWVGAVASCMERFWALCTCASQSSLVSVHGIHTNKAKRKMPGLKYRSDHVGRYLGDSLRSSIQAMCDEPLRVFSLARLKHNPAFP